MRHPTNVIVIDTSNDGHMSLKMYEGRNCVGEAHAPVMDEGDFWPAIDAWRAQRMWNNRQQYLPR